MKLTVFQSDKGDCLLLQSGGKNMLIDGGMKDSYLAHVAPNLPGLTGGMLDLVYVSHIDQDHISGVLQMVDDLVDWRVHNHHLANPDPERRLREPANPQPPEIKAIWHNSFHEAQDDNAGRIADMLAANASVLAAADNPKLLDMAEGFQELATSIAEAIELSRRINAKQLGIGLNEPYQGKLMLVQEGMPAPIVFGDCNAFVIGPFEEDLIKLRAEWNEWLGKNERRLGQIRATGQRDEDRLHTGSAEAMRSAMIGQAEMFGDMELQTMALAEIPNRKLGDRKRVTTPNLASLMLYLEEGGKKVLMTGDGHHADIIKGLKHHGKMAGDRLHVNVLKIQHHGSEHNIDEAFCKAITADTYLFCGNGEHENPDLQVVDTLIKARLSLNDGKDFTLWFNSDESQTPRDGAKEHMKALKELLAESAARSPHVKSFFLDKSFETIEI